MITTPDPRPEWFAAAVEQLSDRWDGLDGIADLASYAPEWDGAARCLLGIVLDSLAAVGLVVGPKPADDELEASYRIVSELRDRLENERGRVVPVEYVRAIDTAGIASQGDHWGDFHPENFCWECGHRNPIWFSPEWHWIHGGVNRGQGEGGITCPNCFMLEADRCEQAGGKLTWMVTPFKRDDAEERRDLALLLDEVASLGDDSDRIASCILNANWHRSPADESRLSPNTPEPGAS